MILLLHATTQLVTFTSLKPKKPCGTNPQAPPPSPDASSPTPLVTFELFAHRTFVEIEGAYLVEVGERYSWRSLV